MPSITREQYQKWNANLKNGFQFDAQAYVIWGDKKARKWIQIDEDTIVECAIQTEKAETDWRGNSRPVRTVIRITEWKDLHTGILENINGDLFSLEKPHPESKTAKYSFTEQETENWAEDIIRGIYQERKKKAAGI